MRQSKAWWQSIAVAILAVGLCGLAAAIGGAYTASSVRDWYPTLLRPSWNPPDWVFAPAWSVLYLLMALAVWMVWRCSQGAAALRAYVLFLAQLALNAAWPALFFGLRRPGLAFVEITVLWVAILATMLAFWRHRPVAAWLLLPYLGWVTFAAVLNLWIALYNP